MHNYASFHPALIVCELVRRRHDRRHLDELLIVRVAKMQPVGVISASEVLMLQPGREPTMTATLKSSRSHGSSWPSVDALAGLPVQLVSRLFANATPHTLAAGRLLFDAGDTGDGCYWLESGLLKVIVKSPHNEARIISVLGPGVIVGEVSVIDGRPRSATVIALHDSALQFLSREAFTQYMEANPEICQYLMVTLATRLRQTVETVAATTFLTVKGRVARALIELAQHIGKKSGDGRIMLEDKISQGDLAAMAGVARENVSRTLRDWKRRKLVTQNSAYYCINNLAALAKEIEFDP